MIIAAEKVRFVPAGRVTDDSSVLTLKDLVFEPLCRWHDGLARPGLFAQWQHDGDGRSWRFRIRDGAVFHDGKPCVAQDIVDYIDAVLGSVDMFGMKWAYARYLEGARITAPSTDILAVDCPRPFADILDIFAEFHLCRETADGAPILGTGPWRVRTYDADRRVELEAVRNPARRLSLVAEAQAEARHDALLAGRVDVAMNLERIAHRIERDPRFTWGEAGNTLSVMYYLKCDAGVFARPEARLAVNHAIDRRRLIDELFHGLAIPAATIVSPYHLGYTSAGVTPLSYDVGRAKALLDRAGGPRDIVIRTPRHMPEKADEISAFVARALAEIGFNARLDVQPDRPEYAREVGRKEIGDMAIFDSSPHSTFRVLSDKISSAVQGTWWQGYDDPETEALIASAGRAVGDEDRAQAYGRCLARLRAQPPWLYLFHPIEVLAAKPATQGLSLDHKGVLHIAS